MSTPKQAELQMRRKEPRSEMKLGIGVFLALACGLAVLVALGGTAIFFSFPTWSERGSFGEMFGAMDAVLSGLALAGVVFTMLLQRQELGYQRRELRAQVETLRVSARLSALSTLAPILHHRIERAEASVRSSEGFKRLVAQSDTLEDELQELLSNSSNADVRDSL